MMQLELHGLQIKVELEKRIDKLQAESEEEE